jgi:hypothetical protein
MNQYKTSCNFRIWKNSIPFNAQKNKEIKSKNDVKNNIKNKISYLTKVNYVQKYNFSTFNNLPPIFNYSGYGGGGGGGGGGPSPGLIIAAITLSMYSVYKRH